MRGGPSDALDGVGCGVGPRSRFEPCRLTSELRSSCQTMGRGGEVDVLTIPAAAESRTPLLPPSPPPHKKASALPPTGLLSARLELPLHDVLEAAQLYPCLAPPLPDEIDERVVVVVVELVLRPSGAARACACAGRGVAWEGVWGGG